MARFVEDIPMKTANILTVHNVIVASVLLVRSRSKTRTASVVRLPFLGSARSTKSSVVEASVTLQKIVGSMLVTKSAMKEHVILVKKLFH